MVPAVLALRIQRSGSKVNPFEVEEKVEHIIDRKNEDRIVRGLSDEAMEFNVVPLKV